MWYLIIVIALFFCLLMFLEESIYYFWNQYVFGPNVERKRKWRKRAKTIISFFKRKQKVDIQETNNEKSSH